MESEYFQYIPIAIPVLFFGLLGLGFLMVTLEVRRDEKARREMRRERGAGFSLGEKRGL